MRTLAPDSILLIRHAERGDIPEGSDGDEVPLTPRGRDDARAFGEKLGAALAAKDGAPIALRGASSPIGRCRETASLILEGAGAEGRPFSSKSFLMSYVADLDAAMDALRTVGYETALKAYIDSGAFPGFTGLREGSQALMAALKSASRGRSLVCVSHDVVILPFLAYFADPPERRGERAWVGFLEGALIDADGRVEDFKPAHLG